MRETTTPVPAADHLGFGRIINGFHRLPMRVYWEDTDASGIVYHANYLRFAERARSDLLRLSGVSQHGMLAEGRLALTVRSLTVDYLRPARLDDELEIRSHLIDLRGASVTALQSVFRAAEELVRLTVRIACIDSAGRPRRLPQPVCRALAPLSRISSASEDYDG